MVEAAIGLGGNLGAPRESMRRALDRLDGPAVRVLRVSSVYETPPWGDPDQPRFLNACALLESDETPQALLARLLELERALGRARLKSRRWGPRLIDLDLLFHGAASVSEPGLEIPHPRMFERAFVLIPLAEIVPDAIVSGRRIADAAEACDREGVLRLGPLA